MRLNQVPADPSGPTPGGGPGAFGSSPAEKQAAANTIENELEDSTKKSTDWADESTNAAIKAFDGWQTAAGLKKVQDTWDQQVKTLMGRLSTEKSNLRGASGLFARNDLDLRGQFAPLSQSKVHDIEPPR
ncbi:hypothetical protein [Streptomyces sp. NPDC048623]|uniref:hypothetical protein n=1 Tax=Streptomyces sp. NPDC048623 TaxID=3155761 RepID=UPI00342039AC